MKIYKIEPQGFASNSFVLTADGVNCIVIDCAQKQVFDFCVQNSLTPKAVLLTHGHFDHVGGCGIFFEKGVPIYCGEKEKELIFSNENRNIFGGVYIPEFKIYKTFKDGEELEICGIKIKVIHTAGHTAGGVCYIAENALFSGDTLFYEGIGRFDLPTGDYNTLLKSVKKLFTLQGDYTVYCGHEGETSLSHERAFNPYIR